MKKWWMTAGLVLSLGVAACAVEEGDDEASSAESSLRMNNTGTTPTEGGGCKITSGPNSGQTGTYDTTSDPGHVWCCTKPNGGGSCTECSGTNKCTSTLTKWPSRVGDIGGFGGTVTKAP